MKRTHCIFIVIFGIITSQSMMLVEGSVEWSASVSTSSFYWKRSLNQLSYNEYSDGDLVGSIGRTTYYPALISLSIIIGILIIIKKKQIDI